MHYAAKSLQSCLTLCDPIDGSPPGSRPWDSPGKSTGEGCHCLLQCMKVKREREVAQSCPTLRGRVDCSPPGSSVHGIFQARVLEWGAIAMDTCKCIDSLVKNKESILFTPFLGLGVSLKKQKEGRWSDLILWPEPPKTCNDAFCCKYLFGLYFYPNVWLRHFTLILCHALSLELILLLRRSRLIHFRCMILVIILKETYEGAFT